MAEMPLMQRRSFHLWWRFPSLAALSATQLCEATVLRIVEAEYGAAAKTEGSGNARK
jgi:hypothetical protein